MSSYGCGIETTDIEFEKTRQWAMNKGNNLAHHLIQAFEPGEVDYEKAHAIGKQLADEILGGKYEYVISTHIDKGHVHNHIIFCAVEIADDVKFELVDISDIREGDDYPGIRVALKANYPPISVPLTVDVTTGMLSRQ